MATSAANEQVVFGIDDGTKVTPKPILNPALLRSRSLGFKELMDGETTNELVELKLGTSSSIDRVAVTEVLDLLQREEVTLEDGNCKLEPLARQCAALWKYRCNPQPFKVLAYRTVPKSSVLSNSPSIDEQSGSSTSGSLGGRPRCWRERRSSRSCGQLITVALVLGHEELLGDEIQVAVWGTQRTVETWVPLEKDIEAIRNYELGKLFDKVYQEINEIGGYNERLAKCIRDAFQSDEPSLGNFHKTWSRNIQDSEAPKDFSPCRFLQAVENDLKGRPPEAPAQAPPTTSQAHIGPKDVPPINVATLVGKVLKFVGLAIAGSDAEKAIIEKMLQRLESFIEGRKKKLVENLMTWRDQQVDDWVKQLAQPDGLKQKESKQE